MSSTPEAPAMPRVVWQGSTKDGEHRLVQTPDDHCTPEKRRPNDAMGNESWEFTQWGGKWQEALAQEFVKLKMGIEVDSKEKSNAADGGV